MNAIISLPNFSISNNKQFYNTIFFSDLHLTIKTIDNAISKFKKQLHNVKTKYLIINGDFVDESVDYYNNKDLAIFLKKLNELLSFLSLKSRFLIWTYGNHDEFFIKKNTKKITKNIQIVFGDYFVVSNTSEKYIFVHGHELDSRFIYHQILKFLPCKNFLRKHTKSKFKKIISYSPPQLKKIQATYSKYTIFNTHQKNTLIFGHFHQENSGEIESLKYFQSKHWNNISPLPLYAIVN